jgi:hypothetical protein
LTNWFLFLLFLKKKDLPLDDVSPPFESLTGLKRDRDHHDGSSSPPSPFVQRQLSDDDDNEKEEYVSFDPKTMKCRDVAAEYERLNTIDEGMYGVVRILTVHLCVCFGIFGLWV